MHDNCITEMFSKLLYLFCLMTSAQIFNDERMENNFDQNVLSSDAFATDIFIALILFCNCFISFVFLSTNGFLIVLVIPFNFESYIIWLFLWVFLSCILLIDYFIPLIFKCATNASLQTSHWKDLPAKIFLQRSPCQFCYVLLLFTNCNRKIKILILSIWRK